MSDDIFTDDEVKSLNEYQTSHVGHPFTCGNGCGDLIATKEGWHCPKCDYKQFWAHDFMKNGTWKRWGMNL